MFISFLAATAASLPTATPIDVDSWFTADDYPAEAAKKGVEGSVRFEVDVDADGKPTACRIPKSSGSELLDQTTCRIVLARAHFKPAMSHGKAVPGRYSKLTIWRLMSAPAVANGYYAAIVDFSKDPDHPTCSVVSKGFPAVPTCEQAMQQLGQVTAAGKFTKVVALVSMTTGDEQPFRGEADWGRRIGFFAIDLYSPKSGGKPACAVVGKEGQAAQLDPCQRYSDASVLSDADKRNAQKAHVEESLFVIRKPSETQGECKNGESEAGAHSCD